ncbi:unnamed protein product [Linum tenue]|uniref:Uncharacterized protein n=1 Tax=Linum tenue TaxID=586396 RepID=A0AAV0RJ38_9ROSI|nr:unnamed protein product [Linum tenue]
MGRLQIKLMKPAVEEEGILKPLDHRHHQQHNDRANLDINDFQNDYYNHYYNDENDGGAVAACCGGAGDWDAAAAGDDDRSPEEDDDEAIDRVMFWESQEALLQEVLERHSSASLKLRQEVGRIIGLAKKTDFCSCMNSTQEGCTSCLRNKVVDMLLERGFNATLCTSQWKNTKKFPGGKHEYVELMASTSARKKRIPYVVELEFKAQFEIAKPCGEYRRMVSLLPEYYIGKADYLNAIVRILCEAAKTSMKEQKIHMGPWRKRSFMQMKWSSSSQKTISQQLEDALVSKKLNSTIQHSSAVPAVEVI